MDPTTGSMKQSPSYGRSCSNCVKAKSKCVPRENGTCERCQRLTKNCQPATFVRARGPRKPPSARKTQLEDKLDSLVTLLQAQSASNPGTSVAASAFALPNAELPVRTGGPQNNSIEQDDGAPLTPLTSEHASNASPQPDVSEQTAEQILSIFRVRCLQFFPFIHLPLEMSPESFRRERPFTFKAIHVACENSRVRQNKLGEQVREDISRSIIAQGERSLDILLGTLVCMSWQFYFTRARPCLGMFSNVAKSLVTDLRLDRPPHVAMDCPKLPPFPDERDMSDTRTDEERRALLACFTMSSMVAMSLKYEPMRWSPQMEKACQRLVQNSDIAGDQIMVAIARISRVGVEAAGMIQQLSDDVAPGPNNMFHIQILRTMLDQVKNTLTSEQLQHKIVQCYLSSTSGLIHEGALFHLPVSPLLPQVLDLQRINHLTACLQASKSSLDNFLDLGLIHMNMSAILSFSHASQVLYKLSVLDYPGWDRTMVRATADVLWYFERACFELERASEVLEQQAGGEESIFFKASLAMRCALPIWKEGLDSALAAENALLTSNNPESVFEAMDTSWLSYPDDVWFGNVFN